MKKRVGIGLVLFVAVLFCAGCKGKAEIRAEKEHEFRQIEIAGMTEALQSEGEAEVSLPTGAFAMAETGELFIAEQDGKIGRYAPDGGLLQSYEAEGYVTTLCLMGDYLFLYTYEDALCRISVEDGVSTTLVGQMLLADMQHMVAVGESLYAFANKEENGQRTAVILQIDPTDGSMETLETPEGNLKAIYGASDGILYYCVERNGSTGLYAYAPEKKESTLHCDLTGRLDEGQPVQCFVYEQGLFAFTALEEELTILSLTEEKSATISLDGSVAFGRDMACVAGNIICRTYLKETATEAFEQIYLGEVELKAPKAPLNGTVTLKGNMVLNTVAIEDASGLKTKMMRNQKRPEEFLLEIMAGNPEVDIYVLSSANKVAQAMKEKGIYVPLNDSDVIKEYKEACFPYIAEEMVTESGDIWMLPCRVSATCIWYVEENMEKFGIGTEELQTLDSFYALSKEMKEKLAGTEYRCYVESPSNFGHAMENQYDTFYCDFKNGVVNYKTEEFRAFFKEQWSDWIIYSPEPVHPFMVDTQVDDKSINMIWEHPRFSTERVVYKWTWPSAHLEYGAWEGWRVSPEPRFSETIEGNCVDMVGLIVNPYSEQKDLAVAYLEAIAENPVGTSAGISNFPFLFEDMSLYEERYDITLPAVQDMYQLFKDGYLSGVSYPYPDTFVLEYQEGRLTLEETLEKMERDTEMWLNE